MKQRGIQDIGQECPDSITLHPICSQQNSGLSQGIERKWLVAEKGIVVGVF
jgi:hypothetical protein